MTDEIKALKGKVEEAIRQLELNTSDENFWRFLDAKDQLAALDPESAAIDAKYRAKKTQKRQDRVNEMIPSIQLVSVITSNDRNPWCLGVSYHGRQFYLCTVSDVRTQKRVSQEHYLEATLPDGVSVIWVDHCGSEKRAELEAALLTDR